MQDEILTEDLLARLLSAEKPEAYLEEGTTLERTLPDYLFELLADRGMRRSEVVRASGLNPTVVYDTFTGKMVPGRDNAIMLAFGLRCDVRETQQLLRLAGSAELWPKVRRDAIIIWCIKEGKTRSQCDDELWKFGEKDAVRHRSPPLIGSSLSLEGEEAVRTAAGHAVGMIQRAACPPLRSCPARSP